MLEYDIPEDVRAHTTERVSYYEYKSGTRLVSFALYYYFHRASGTTFTCKETTLEDCLAARDRYFANNPHLDLRPKEPSKTY